MRHSGTAILFEAFAADPDFGCHFEPFREESPIPGGDSGARALGLFAETRRLRRAFQRERAPQVPLELFNHGGPRAPSLELHPGLPEWATDFLRYLLEQDENSLIQEVRMFRKVARLHELDPGAALIHLVRDPRAVSTSMMLGRNRQRLGSFANEDAFFEAWTRRRMSSTRAIADARLQAAEHPRLRRGVPDFMRPLLVWLAAFEGTHAEGQALFGERYVLLRIEDLRTDPAAALGRIYAALGRSLPAGVSDWAQAGVPDSNSMDFAKDPRWAEARDLIGMGPALASAGYEELAALPRPNDAARVKLTSPDADSASRLDAVIGRARRSLDRAAGRSRR